MRISASPPPRDPVKPTAAIRGSATSAPPSSFDVPLSSEKTPSGKPEAATAPAIAPAISSDGAGMRRMALDDDRASGGERRGGVAARDREGEREIRCAEHRDRAKRHHAQAQIGARQWLAVGQRRIDPHAKPAAIANLGSEQAELADGAPALAGQPRDRQARFGVCTVEQFVAHRHDVVGNGLQESRARLKIGGRILRRGGGGERAGAGHLRLPRGAETWLEHRSACGIDGIEEIACSLARLADEQLAGNRHPFLLMNYSDIWHKIGSINRNPTIRS